MVCQELLERGICSRGDACPAGHYLKMCNLCNCQLTTPNSFRAHCGGKEHNRRLYYGGGFRDGMCLLCEVPLDHPASTTKYKMHARTESHVRHVMQLFETDNVRRDVQNVPHGSVVCHTCNKFIPEHVWHVHLRTRRHIAATRFHDTKAQLEEISRNKHSIEVSGDELDGFDFGVVDPQDRLSTRPLVITLTARENVSLIDVRLSSQSGPNKFRKASHFTLPSWRGRLVFGQPTRQTIIFHAHDLLGRFEDRLELVFEDTSLDQRFSIARTMRAVVGDPIELRQLEPVTPYVRPRRKRWEGKIDIVDGIRVPFISEIQWAVALAQYRVPLNIMKAISIGNTQQQLDTVKHTILPSQFNSPTYARHWSTLLHVEETQMALDLTQFDMERKELTKEGVFYKLLVPGLAEKRPSVILGDAIRVRNHGGQDHWFAGYVHRVEQREVYLRFNPSFNSFKGQLYDVRFSLNRTSLRRMHQALGLAWNPERILFPTFTHVASSYAPTPQEIEDLRLFNRILEDNPSQKLAVSSILTQLPGSVPFVIFGPPGTGKTVVAVEAMRQILARDPQARILACAPSNSAADLLAERLGQQGIAATELLRLNAATRLVGSVSKNVKIYCRQQGDAFVIPPVEEMRRYRVVVSTCISASLPYAIGIERGHYSHIFIDEAGQALETEAMIPIRTLAGTQTNIVLSGDPKQLGPIVRSTIATKLGLAVSYLDRMMDRPIYDEARGLEGVTFVKLKQNFRSHEAILRFPNELFYNGDLEVCADPMIINSLVRWDRLVRPTFPIIFHAISGEDMREASSPSFFNPHEVLVVKDYVQALRENQKLRLTDDQIGIISPYNAQNGKIRSVVNETKYKKSRPGTLKVGSVEEYQGQERRVIIISTVRSNTNFVEFDIKHSLGFVANPRRFNVAITRAQALLIVVGDPVVLSLDPMWRAFLEYIHTSGGWRGKAKDWESADSNDSILDFVEERRTTAQTAMEELTKRMQETIISDLPEQEDEEELSNDGEELQDKPWREEE